MYICAMILDPKFKLSFWKNNNDFIYEHYNVSSDKATKIFEQAATDFESNLQTHKSKNQETTPVPVEKARSIFASALYQPAPEIDGIQAEIKRYLNEDIKSEGIKILQYWASRKRSFPQLAQMARCYLSIPATSASSERVFSKGRRVLSWQRSSLKPKSVEELLCLKDWFQSFDSIF